MNEKSRQYMAVGRFEDRRYAGIAAFGEGEEPESHAASMRARLATAGGCSDQG